MFNMYCIFSLKLNLLYINYNNFMKHKKLLENVMIDLLKDPTCPIYQVKHFYL